jgi:acyl carrier protein
MTAIPSRAEILDGIAEVARTHLASRLGEVATLSPHSRLVEDLGLDSLDLFTLAAEVENRFRVALDAGDEAAIVTVADLAERIEQKLAG